MNTTSDSRRLRRSRWLAVPFAAIALVAVSCGGSSDSSDGGSSDTDTDGASESEFVANMPECPADALANATSPVTITVWQAYNAKPKEGFDQLVAEFNASQDKVVIDNQSQGATYDEIWTKYQAAAGANDLPNLAILEDVQSQEMADSGTVLPAQSCINAEGTDTSTFMPAAVAHYSIDGALVPASANLSSTILYYNKNHFRTAGLDPETSPGTLAEVREYAQKLKESGASEAPMVLYLHPWFINTWLTGAKAPIVNNENGHGPGITDESTFDNATTAEIYTWIQDMYNDGLLNAIPYDGKSIDHYLAMQSGKGSMLIETSNAAISIEALLAGDTVATGQGDVSINTDSLNVGAGPMPGLTAPGQVEISGGAFYMTNSGTPEQQAATWEFMKWWNSAATQAKWNLIGSYIPFNQAAVSDPTVVDYWANDLAGGWLKISADQIADISVDNTGPVMGPMQQYFDVVRDSLSSLVLEAKTPADAIASVATANNQQLADYNEGGF